MSHFITPNLNTKLSKHTTFFGLQVWIVILICIAVFLTLFAILFICSTIFSFHRKKLQELRSRLSRSKPDNCRHPSLDISLISKNIADDVDMIIPDHLQWSSYERRKSSVGDFESVCSRLSRVSVGRDVYQFTYKEIEMATNAFFDRNVIGCGKYGIVYRGVLMDNTRVAVKKFWSYRRETENFRQDLEAIGNVRHKNLVNLLGYCHEGAHRMLVYEYIDNNNLYNWLSGYGRAVSPLTWSMRMKIISGIAKGLVYLQEDVEPNMVHQNIKSSNVLLDHQLNAKLSDFGIVKLFHPDGSDSIACSVTPFADEDPQHTFLREQHDVYSFGLLIAEIVSGRTPAETDKPQSEILLIDWFKDMVASQKIGCVLDPNMIERPSSKELKRLLLVALRCVDPDLSSRPKMGDVIRMLEPHDLLLLNDQMVTRESSSLYPRVTDTRSVAEKNECVIDVHWGGM